MRSKASIALVALLVAACASSPPPASETASAVASATPSSSPSAVRTSAAPTASPVPTASPSPAGPVCPNPGGGQCLGLIDAGTYTTGHFSPTLTYTVPAGWSNMEDLAGNFLLLPPGSALSGVNTNGSDYLGVYTSVVAPELCTGRGDPNTPDTFDGLVAWLKADPSLTVTRQRKVTISGLKGVEMDIAMARPAGDGCAEGIWADIYVGKFPTDLVHAVGTDYPIRLYLLRYGDQTLAIEAPDAVGGSDYADWWATSDAVVKTFVFQP